MCVMALSVGSAVASTDYLHIRTSSGWQVLNVDDLKSFDFNNGTVTVSDKDGKAVASFPQSSLELIYVDDNTQNVDKTGVESVTEEASQAVFAYDSAARMVTFSQDGEFELYNVDGSRLVRIPDVKAGETVNISGVAPGVVILKSGKQTIKTILK